MKQITIRRVMAVVLAAGIMLACALPVSAHQFSVETTVSRVFMKQANKVPYCDVSLANGRWLLGVAAGLCNGLKRGTSVTLWYEDVLVEAQVCDWQGRCKMVMVTQNRLVSWY